MNFTHHALHITDNAFKSGKICGGDWDEVESSESFAEAR